MNDPAPPAPPPSAWARVDAAFNGWLFGPEGPLRLGVSRAVACGLYAAYFGGFDSFTGYAAAADALGVDAPGLAEAVLAPGIPPDPVMAGLHAAWVLALALGALGLFTRPALWVAAALAFYLLALPTGFGKVSHVEPTAVWVLLILASSRCGDAFSLDALRRERAGRPAPAPSGAYRWPVRLVWVQVSLVFGLAGWQKIEAAGLAWAMPASFVPMTIEHFYYADPVSRLALWLPSLGPFAAFFGLVSLLGEALFPLVLVSRRARLILPPMLFSMQIGIALFLGIYFWPFLPAYAFFVPWERVVQSWGEDGRALGSPRERVQGAGLRSQG